MRIIKIMLPIILIVLTIGLPRVEAQSNKPGDYRIDGNYRVVIKPDHYPSYSTIVTVTRIDSQNIKISGTYDGLPLIARGVLRNGSSSPGMDTYDIEVRNSLFSGKVVLNFQPINKECRINGFGSGNYNYLGLAGSATGTITGVNSKIHFNISAIILILLIIGAMGLFLWLSHRHQPTGK